METVEAGQQCIEFLKKQNLGRANFTCLDKLKEKDMSPFATPENVPRLFDLIKPKENRFRVAFYQALNDTLVANDLAQANRIAFGKSKRYRVVTLDGQLIDVSGTMSGGGNRPQKGGMSSKFVTGVSDEQIAQLQDAQDQAERAYQEAKRRVTEAIAESSNSASEIPKLEMEMSKLQMNMESIVTEINDFEGHIQGLLYVISMF